MEKVRGFFSTRLRGNSALAGFLTDFTWVQVMIRTGQHSIAEREAARRLILLTVNTPCISRKHAPMGEGSHGASLHARVQCSRAPRQSALVSYRR